MKQGLAVLLTGIFLGVSAFAEDSVQPYIDQIKKDMQEAHPTPTATPTTDNPDPYLQSIKKNLPKQSDESYIDAVKKSDPAKFGQPPPPSYTEEQKKNLPNKDTGGAIAALKEGRSKLHAKKEGTVHNRFGIRFNAASSRVLGGNPNVIANNFDTIYGGTGDFRPNFSLYFEHYLHRSSWVSLGVMVESSFTYYSGFGQFAFAPPQGGTWDPNGGGGLPTSPTALFSQTSLVPFRFYTFPIVIAPVVHFELSKYFRPFVTAGPTAVGFIESRGDSNINPGQNGYSKGIYGSAGADIQLDSVSDSASWDLYEEYHILHSYLTLEYSRQSTISSDVSITQSGIYLGIAFEY